MKLFFKSCIIVVGCLICAIPPVEAQPAKKIPLPSGGTKIFLPSVIRKMGTGSNSMSLLKESDALNIARNDKYFGQKTKQQNQYWVVYSDRDKNPAYTTSNGNTVNCYLEFNQRVTIADIDYNSRRALVYEDLRIRTWPALPQNANEYTCFGWVPMDKLLLWDSCPTDKSGIYNKALLSLNLDASSKATEKEAKIMYLDPESSNSSKPLSLDEKIYFIMKREGDKALLSTQYTLNGASSYRVLLGWVRDISYVAWSQRSCLEPTWKEEDVEYFSRNRIKATVEAIGGADSMQASSWDFNQSRSMKAQNDKKYNGHAANPYRIPGHVRRFPILEKEKNRKTGTRYHVTSFSRSGKGKSAMSVDFDSWGLANDELRAMQNINLVIVMDGTKSMEPFYAPAQKGIQDGCASLQTITASTIKLGAVIYRDVQDISNGTSYEVERLPRLVNYSDPSFNRFLSSGGDYGIKSSSRDKTLEESLFRGIESGIAYFQGKEKESNIILVVGDCGNLYDAPLQEELCKKLIRYNVQIMGYQVRIDSNPKRSAAYLAFTDQMFDIVSKTIKGIYAGQKRADNYVVFRLKGNHYVMNQTDKRSHVGSVISPLDGSVMNSGELSDYIFTTISEVQKAIQYQLDIVVGWANGNWDVDPDFLVSRGLDPKSTHDNISFQGWTQMQDKQSGRDFYKPVLFLSEVELQTLVAELSKAIMQNQKPDRKAFVDALRDVAAKHVGLDGQDLNNLSLKEITNMVCGLNEETELLNARKTLEQIMQPSKVSDNEFQKMYLTFEHKVRKLQEINEDYQGYYEFNLAKYYWIPIEDLP